MQAWTVTLRFDNRYDFDYEYDYLVRPNYWLELANRFRSNLVVSVTDSRAKKSKSGTNLKLSNIKVDTATTAATGSRQFLVWSNFSATTISLVIFTHGRAIFLPKTFFLLCSRKNVSKWGSLGLILCLTHIHASDARLKVHLCTTCRRGVVMTSCVYVLVRGWLSLIHASAIVYTD